MAIPEEAECENENPNTYLDILILTQNANANISHNDVVSVQPVSLKQIEVIMRFTFDDNKYLIIIDSLISAMQENLVLLENKGLIDIYNYNGEILYGVKNHSELHPINEAESELIQDARIHIRQILN